MYRWPMMCRILPVKLPYQLYQQQIPVHFSHLNLPFPDIHTFCGYMVKVIEKRPSHSYNRYASSPEQSSASRADL